MDSNDPAAKASPPKGDPADIPLPPSPPPPTSKICSICLEQSPKVHKSRVLWNGIYDSVYTKALAFGSLPRLPDRRFPDILDQNVWACSDCSHQLLNSLGHRSGFFFTLPTPLLRLVTEHLALELVLDRHSESVSKVEADAANPLFSLSEILEEIYQNYPCLRNLQHTYQMVMWREMLDYEGRYGSDSDIVIEHAPPDVVIDGHPYTILDSQTVISQAEGEDDATRPPTSPSDGDSKGHPFATSSIIVPTRTSQLFPSYPQASSVRRLSSLLWKFPESAPDEVTLMSFLGAASATGLVGDSDGDERDVFYPDVPRGSKQYNGLVDDEQRGVIGLLRTIERQLEVLALKSGRLRRGEFPNIPQGDFEQHLWTAGEDLGSSRDRYLSTRMEWLDVGF